MDISYMLASHFKLSTSQVPSISDSVMCYGPSVPDGYGVCYNLCEDYFNVGISSYFTSPQTSSVVFGEHLVQTLAEFKSLLELEGFDVAVQSSRSTMSPEPVTGRSMCPAVEE